MLLDSSDIFIRHLDAGPGGNFHIDYELPRIGAGKKRLAEKWVEAKRQNNEGTEPDKQPHRAGPGTC